MLRNQISSSFLVHITPECNGDRANFAPPLEEIDGLCYKNNSLLKSCTQHCTKTGINPAKCIFPFLNAPSLALLLKEKSQ